MLLGIGGFRVTCSNRNLRLPLQERIAEPSLQLIGGEQSHGDRAIVMNSRSPRSAKTVCEVRESARATIDNDLSNLNEGVNSQSSALAIGPQDPVFGQFLHF